MFNFKLGPLEINWSRKEVPPMIAPYSGAGLLFGSAQRGPKSKADALRSVVGWTFACVDAIASRCASIPYNLYRNEDIINPEAMPAFYDLWNRPNFFFSAWNMRYLLFAHLASAGEAYWYFYDGGLMNPNSRRMVPTEVWPLDPSKVELEYKDGDVHYIYNGERGRVRLDSDRVLHFQRPNTEKLFGSMSALRAVGIEMDTSEYIAMYQWNWFRGGNWTPYALKTDQQLQQQQVERIGNEYVQRFREARTGNRPLILHSGTEPVSFPIGGDLELTSLDEGIRDKILAAFRTPKSKLGYSESANKASMFAADKAWNQEVIEPLLVMVDSVLDQKWLPIYGNPGINGSFDSPVPTDMEEVRANVETGFRTSSMTRNEIRNELGLEPIDGGDVILIPFAMIETGGNGNRQLMGQLGAVRSLTGDARHVLPRHLSKAFWTEERKDSYWLGFIKSTESNERKWHRVLRQIFTTQEEDIKDLLTDNFKRMSGQYANWSRPKVEKALEKDARLDNVEVAVMEWVSEFDEKGYPILRSIYEEAGKAAVDLTATGISFEIDNQLSAEYLKKRSYDFARRVNETTAADLRRILSEGVLDGESIDQLSKRVADYYGDQARDYRTNRIARTETLASTNAGSYDGYKQAGVSHKAWLSARDQATRDDHLELDSKYREETAIPMDEPFEIDGSRGMSRGMFPGEFDTVEQNVNCRCTFVGVEP